MAKVRFPFDHFQIDTPEAFRAKAGQAGYKIPVSSDLSSLRKSFSVDGHRFENAMAVQPLEGLDGSANGAPTSLTHARYEKLAAQGAGLLWVEATAICPEGRDSLQQLWINRESLPGFQQLVQTIDQAAVQAGYRPPYKILQLTHSGRCSVDASGMPKPQAAFASPYLDPAMGTPEIVTDEYLDQLQEQFGEAVVLAAEAGFDAVELKLCHQYLFKELLCAYTRPGRYGGSQENRFRFAHGAIDQVRRRLGTRIDIVVRLNAYDGIPWPYGWGMAKPEGWKVQGGPDGVKCPYSNANAASSIDDIQTNWPGNPAPVVISEAEKSSWRGNPERTQLVSEGESNWHGNPDNTRIRGVVASNWSGNPQRVRLTEEERSNWSGNPDHNRIRRTVASNWTGNPRFSQGQGCPLAQVCAQAASCAQAQAGSQASAGACQLPGGAGSLPTGPMQIDLTEVKELMRQLYRKGIRIFNLSTTSPRFAPAGNGYMDNFSETAEVDPFAGVSALLAATKEIRGEMPSDLKIVGTGLSWFGPFSASVGAGGIEHGWFDIAGFGRSVMADNHFIPSILQGNEPGRTSFCMGCDHCFELFFADLPTGCAMRRPAYRDLYQGSQAEGRLGSGNVIY